MAKCILCREYEAVIPDRNRPGRPIKRICRQCHAERLQGDFREVMRLEKERWDKMEAELRPGERLKEALLGK